jgi:hypothetical protein
VSDIWRCVTTDETPLTGMTANSTKKNLAAKHDRDLARERRFPLSRVACRARFRASFFDL